MKDNHTSEAKPDYKDKDAYMVEYIVTYKDKDAYLVEYIVTQHNYQRWRIMQCQHPWCKILSTSSKLNQFLNPTSLDNAPPLRKPYIIWHWN